jgi:hypothetical protein
MSDSGQLAFKECPQCGRILPITDFHRNQRRADGRAYYCKRCAGERSEASRRRRGIKQQRRPLAVVPDGMKWCPDCDTVRPLEDFARTKSKATGYHSYCLPCHNARGRETKQRLYGGTREYHLRHRYGIGQREVEELLAEQGGVCAICGADNPEHVDHDHKTGHIRGLLCFNCNGGLGQFRDNVDYLTSAITYLKGSTWQRVLVHPGVYRLFSPRRGRRPSRSF